MRLRTKMLIASLAVAFVVLPFAADAALSQSQIDSILGLLESFGADQATINNVNSALNGQATSGTGSSAATCNFTRDLSVGSQGADVQCLQRYLNSAGFTVAQSGPGSVGNTTQYFGSLTQNAVSRWQSANNVSPTSGYFGPISRATYNSLVADSGDDAGDDDSGDTGSTGSTGLSGGAGAIEDATFISSLNNEEVGEGDNNVQVMGLEIEADEGSDIEITAVNVDFDKGASGNSLFKKYADEVSIWFDGDKVAEVDADEFTDDNNYGKTISLDSGAIIRAGQKENLVIAVSGISNMDSADEGDTWDVAFGSVRFRDGQGAVISDTSTGNIGNTNDTTTVGTDERQFSFESFVTSANTKLKFLKGDSDINDARIIDVDANNTTDNVDFFSFKIEVEGTGNVELDDLPLTWTASDGLGGGSTQVDEIISSAELWIDGVQVDSLTIPSTATTTSILTFDDFNYDLEAGEIVDAMVKVDLQKLDGTNFQAGNDLKVTLSETETDDGDFDARDAEGNTLADGDVTGSSKTEAHTFFDNGFNVALVSSSGSVAEGDASATEDHDRATFTVVYDVTAFGSDVYLGTSTEDDNSATAEDGVNYGVLINGSADTDATSTATIKMTDEEKDGTTDAFIVRENQTERFTLTVNLTATEDNFFEIQLNSIGWSADTDATADANKYPSKVLTDFDAGPVYMETDNN